MSALASLVRAYDRLAERGEAPKYGFARTPISFSIRIDREGNPTCLPIDLREAVGKENKLLGRRIDVPTFLGQRTSGIDADFLWDKTQYTLGVSKPDPKKSSADQVKEASRALKTHQACIELHRKHLASETDEGLIALLRFMERWKPEHFDGWPDEMKGENVVFELDGDRRFIHERPAACALWLKVLAEEPAIDAICLVDGIRTRVPLTHPPIKGVRDAQPSGAPLVSFNLDAFTSYGHEQGENAPVSEKAAFAYTTALNHFLEKGSAHQIQIGDATTAFWADASDAKAAEDAEGFFAAVVGVTIDESVEAKKVRPIVQAIREGRPITDFEPGLEEGVRFFVLGLAPNAARLSVRYFVEDNFAHMERNLVQHMRDLIIEPWPFTRLPSAWSLLNEACVHVPRQGPNGRTNWERSKNSKPPAVLGGDFMRAILTGVAYPRTLLSAIIQRISAESGRVTARRVAMCKAVINREIRLRRSLRVPVEAEQQSDQEIRQEVIPVALDRNNLNQAYRLGRLFALLERLQELGLPGLNATIRDRSFAGANSTPAHVFPLLIKTSQHHAAAARKDPSTRKLAYWLENQIGEVWSGLEPNMPRALRIDDQARFTAGYYHQRFSSADNAVARNLAAAADVVELDGENDKE